jgi:hypothetical protein
MPDILIRGLNAKTVQRLKARAKANGRSLQGEARLALEQAAGLTFAEMRAISREWHRRLRGVSGKLGDSVSMIREDRER